MSKNISADILSQLSEFQTEEFKGTSVISKEMVLTESDTGIPYTGGLENVFQEYWRDNEYIGKWLFWISKKARDTIFDIKDKLSKLQLQESQNSE